MNNDLNRAASALNKGQLQRIEDGQGSRVLCISGCLWLTQQGSRRDIVLNAGDEIHPVPRRHHDRHGAERFALAACRGAWSAHGQPESPWRQADALSAGVRRALWLA